MLNVSYVLTGQSFSNNDNNENQQTEKMEATKRPVSCSVRFDMNPSDLALATIPGTVTKRSRV